MQEIMEEVDLDQFVNQPVPDDPEKLRLSLIFSKDLITTLQQDIADLHHRLHIADTEYDETNDMDDEEDDIAAGLHVTNATLTHMDGDMVANELEHQEEEDLYGHTQPMDTSDKRNLYDMNDDPEEDEDDYDEDDAANVVLNKKQSDHERFFSTYNILHKQVHTQQTLIESMGSYQALLHLSDNAITFNEIVANLQLQLKTAKDSFHMVRDALNGIGVEINLDEEEDIMHKSSSLSDDEDEDLEKKLFISNAKEILRESQKVVTTIDFTIDELNGAKHLIHPDQKKIFSLQSRLKELEVALPLHKIKKLAILNELPRFIKQELSDAKIQKQAQEARELQRLRESRGHKKKRTKTLVDDDIPDVHLDDEFQFNADEGDEHDEERKETQVDETRIETFESTMDGISTCIEKLQSRLNNINDNIEAMEGDMETMEDPAADLLRTSMGDIQDEMKTCEDAAHDIVTYFVQAKEYVHPTQNVLITAVNQYVEQKIENDRLQKQIEILHSELEVKGEEIKILKGEASIGDTQNDLEEETQTQEFVSQIVKQLRQLRDDSESIHNGLKQSNSNNKRSLSYDEIKRMDGELFALRETLEDVSARLIHDDEHSLLKLTPTNEYILTLESRYLHLKKLYRLKFKELETLKDSVIYNESVIESKNEDIEELESRLVRIMTSASTSTETRMDAINTMNHKSQTYRSVMDVIENNLRVSSSALHGIEKLVKSKEMHKYCKTIKKGLESVQAEMSGARNFVHPDREMVHALQEQILEDRLRYTKDNSTTANEVKTDEEDSDDNTEVETANKGGVHFKSKTSAPNRSLGSSAYDRRTKSVHEIAWSKFNAGHETNMEDLERKEREVLEEDIRSKILDQVQAEYDDRFDREVATMRAQLQQDIREQIRLEYEDLEATYAGNHYQDNEEREAEIEQIKVELEQQYDTRLEEERKKMDVFYKGKQNELNESHSQVQQQCVELQDEIENAKHEIDKAKQDTVEVENRLKKQIDDVRNSKLQLINSTSCEIDKLRFKIKMYTQGNWDKIIND
eukprot:328609_1